MESRNNTSSLFSDQYFRKKIFSIIGHDLKGPVGSIKMLADIILDSPDEYTREELLETMGHFSDAAGTASSLLENLVTWSQTINGEIRFNPAHLDIEPVLNLVAVSLLPRARQKGLTIGVNVTPGLTAFYDREMVRIITRNILENAIKFTDKDGKVTIAAKDLPDHRVEVAVSDSGIGISDEILQRLNSGEPFVTTYGTDNEKGSGLGLILCRDLISLNGGLLTIQTTAGSGSCFTFTLPANKAR